MSINLKTVSIILVVLGILVSGYISYTTLTGGETVCVGGGHFDCGAVQSSKYSKFMGIPVAYIGLATYLFILGLIVLEERIALLQDNSVLFVFGITLFAFLYSMYLVYLQWQVLDAWCNWCLMHEVIMTLLFITTVFRLMQVLYEDVQEA